MSSRFGPCGLGSRSGIHIGLTHNIISNWRILGVGIMTSDPRVVLELMLQVVQEHDLFWQLIPCCAPLTPEILFPLKAPGYMRNTNVVNRYLFFEVFLVVLVPFFACNFLISRAHEQLLENCFNQQSSLNN